MTGALLLAIFDPFMPQPCECLYFAASLFMPCQPGPCSAVILSGSTTVPAPASKLVCVCTVAQADDIERPAQLPPDQLPVMIAQPGASDSPQRNTDQLPTTAPASTSMLGGSRSTGSQPAAAQASHGGRRDAHRAQPGAGSTGSHRRRW